MATTPAWSALLAPLVDERVEARRSALFAIGAAVRAGHPEADASLVGAMVSAMGDADAYNAGLAAGVLRQLAQYRRGDISGAADALAGAVVSTASQELRKEAGEALVELCENGAGLPGSAVGLLEPLLDTSMKHGRQLAATALAAHAARRRDAARLEALLIKHPRLDVRERAVGYLVRGAEWMDAFVALPTLCVALRDHHRAVRRRATAAIAAVLRGPRVGWTPDASHAAAAAVVLAALETMQPEPEVAREHAQAIGLARALATEEAQRARADALLAALRESGDSASWRERVVEADLVRAVVAGAVAEGSWGPVAALVEHPRFDLRVAALEELAYRAARSTLAMAPLVPALARCLDERDASVQAAALDVLSTLAHAGSALARTDLAVAEPQLVALAGSRGPLAERAATALSLARSLGGLVRRAAPAAPAAPQRRFRPTPSPRNVVVRPSRAGRDHSRERVTVGMELGFTWEREGVGASSMLVFWLRPERARVETYREGTRVASREILAARAAEIEVRLRAARAADATAEGDRTVAADEMLRTFDGDEVWDLYFGNGGFTGGPLVKLAWDLQDEFLPLG